MGKRRKKKRLNFLKLFMEGDGSNGSQSDRSDDSDLAGGDIFENAAFNSLVSGLEEEGVGPEELARRRNSQIYVMNTISSSKSKTGNMFSKTAWETLNKSGTRWAIRSFIRFGRSSFISKSLLNSFGAYLFDSIWWFETKLPLVALTIDDVPGLDHKTNEDILSLLAEYNIKCTFFVTERNAKYIKGADNFLRRCVSEGHELGNHLAKDIPAHKLPISTFSKHLLDCENLIAKYNPGYISSDTYIVPPMQMGTQRSLSGSRGSASTPTPTPTPSLSSFRSTSSFSSSFRLQLESQSQSQSKPQSRQSTPYSSSSSSFKSLESPRALVDNLQQGGASGAEGDFDTTFQTPFRTQTFRASEIPALNGESSRRYKWFRPPFGRLTKQQYDMVISRGYTVVMCDVYPNDVSLQGFPQFLAQFCTSNAAPGSIVCVHIPSNSFRSANIQVFKLMLPELSKKYRCVTLSELAEQVYKEQNSEDVGR
ncbi:Polysaccharide deacetylase family protein [Cryptosporidium felis]|nr:Polysaccharide deacetylase family protein [Cryptosporidium felis]